jgi:hypothetical protein
MKLDYVPLLQIQRQLQTIPRGMGRFRQYLRTISPDGANLELPSLLAANPMSKDHVTALLDALLALDADAVAARAVAEASARVADEPGDFKVALVILDDLMGGWTNRYAEEFTWRFQVGPPPPAEFRLPRWTKVLLGQRYSLEQRARHGAGRARGGSDGRLPGRVCPAARPCPHPPGEAHPGGLRPGAGGLYRACPR